MKITCVRHETEKDTIWRYCGKAEGFSHKNGGEDSTDERCTCKEDVTLRQMNRENLASSGTSAHSWLRSMKQKRVRYGGTFAFWKGFSHNNGGEEGVEDAFASRHKTQPRPARQRSPSPEQGTRNVNDMRRKT